MALAFRPIRPDDEPFLYAVYASTRADELAPLGWTAAQREAFLRGQFEARRRHYRDQFPEAQFLIVLRDDRPVGQIYVDRRPDEIRLIDIALLPAHRGQGIGTALLEGLLEEAGQTRRPVRLHVEAFNPARRLYARLGFREVEDRGVYLLLEWTPGAGRAPVSAPR